MILPATIFIVAVLIDVSSIAVNNDCVDGSHCKDDACGDLRCLNGCQDGFFGPHCTNNCSSGCKDGKCDSSGKSCIGDCIDGQWGSVCKLRCFSSCKTCAKDNGSECTSCEEYRYGPHCEQSCSSKCHKLGCHINGNCKNRCGDRCRICDDKKQKCDGCRRGTFGPLCQWRCNTNCADEICHQVSAHCVAGCRDEYFGPRCEYRCNEQCDQGKCEQDTGMCLQGCRRGYYGPDCILPCDSCLSDSCDNTSGECLEGCKMGFFGKGCKNRCNDHCISGYCSRFDGVCYEPEVPTATNATTGMSHDNNKWIYIIGGCAGVLLCSVACFLAVRYRRICCNQPRGGLRQRMPLPPIPIPHDDLYDELDVGHADSCSRPTRLTAADNAERNVDLHVDMSNTSEDKNKQESFRLNGFGNECPVFPDREVGSWMSHVQMAWLMQTEHTAGDNYAMRTERVTSTDLDGGHDNSTITSPGGRFRPSRNYLSPVKEDIKT
ncbi:scavenger receptor class F member 2-like [Haliotis cracherodii]|uniref:scavenger receptor class F member 2-like n=1 Tax=Haliotis cracherodii TaxID=6455 RepID=UPI0039E83460